MENSMLQRQEAEKKSASSVGNSTMQLAKMVGNQAVVQMMPEKTAWGYTDVCTPHFIRDHLRDDCPGTMFSKAFMDALADDFNGYVDPSEINWHGADFTFRSHMFTTSERDERIHHYNGRFSR